MQLNENTRSIGNVVLLLLFKQKVIEQVTVKVYGLLIINVEVKLGISFLA
jgi:hypothetical protein